jgi:hypothetical protein
MVSADTRSEQSTRLSGAWLVLARGVCVALFGFSLTVFFVDLPGYFARLQLICGSSACALGQLTPTSLLKLQQVGFTVQSYAILYRYRYVSTPAQRQQTKWIVLGVIVGVLVLVGSYLPPLLFSSLNHAGLYFLIVKPVSTLILLFAPLCFGIAILRYRLYDIDILINRTLVYGTLTVMLALVYFGLVIGGQHLLVSLLGQSNAVVLVVSTLIVAALFQPLRQRIQRTVDRRFYRSKYDAARIVAAFNATLRQEVDLDQLREHLLAVVQETMQPTHVSLWLRKTDQERKSRTTDQVHG